MSKRYIGGLISAFNSLKVANAPTIGAVSGSCASVCVAFTAPSCVGGGAITSYIAVSNPGFKTGTGSTSPVTVNCLTNGTSYTFTVSANNAYGPSAFSAASSSVSPVAAFGIFAFGGNSSLVTNKYTFSTCANAVGTSLANLVYNQRAAVGNKTKAIVGNNNVWFFSGCTVSSGGFSCSQLGYGAAAGNSTVGIVAIGAGAVSPYNGNNCFPVSAARKKYTYATCTQATATSSSANGFGQSAAGTCSVGIFALGSSNFATTNPTTTRDKYTYSGDTNASATAASAASYVGGAIGNTTVGIFALGYTTVPTTTRNKYTYSGDTNATATSSTIASGYNATTGNATVGIFQLGSGVSGAISCRNKYTYSGCVNSSGTAASANPTAGNVGFSVAISGVNA